MKTLLTDQRRTEAVCAAWWVLPLLALSACAGSTGLEARGQSPAVPLASPLSDATILIIRHAEKPAEGKGLSPEGEARARAYVQYFKDFKVSGQPIQIDYLVAADDSDHSQRSRLTLEPLGRSIGLQPDLHFQAKRPQDLVRQLESSFHGRNIVICWHHREIPQLLEAFGVEADRLLPHGEWPAQQFGWVLQLRYDHQGKLLRNKTRRIKEHLMPGD